jgi:diguanylate cyclase (GGDEF)-like protein
LFIWFIFAAGAIFTRGSLPVPEFSQTEFVAFAVLTVLATGAQLFKAEGADHQLYYGTRVFQFAAILLLHPFYYILLVVIAHTIEWVKERWINSLDYRRWYLQPFNIATHIIAGLVARHVYETINTDFFNFTSTTAIIAILSAAAVYVLLNHFIVGLALILGRSVSLRASGILTLESLLPDFINMALGSIVAIVWNINPFLTLLAISPLVLIHRALLVPRLKKEASTDSKTGLWTARHFMQLYSEELQRASRFNRPLSFIMADLDLLRNINNTYGHLAGDAVLAGVASVIRQNIRDFDIAGRFGGEEFAIVLPETTAHEALKVAEALRLAVEASTFSAPTTSAGIRATLSLGVAAFPDDAQVAEQLVHAADVAVYQAKLSGRNRTVGAFEVPHSVTVEYLNTADRLDMDTAYAAMPAAGIHFPVGRETAQSTQPAAPDPLKTETPIAAHAPAASAEIGAPSAVLRLFVGAVIVTAALIAVGAPIFAASPNWYAAALFAILAGVGEVFQVDLYGEGTVSVSVAVSFAAAFIAGIPGVVAASVAVGAVHFLRRRPPAYKAVFSWATHVISGSLIALIFAYITVPLTFANAFTLAIPIITIAALYFIVDTGLIAAAIGLESKSPVLSTWRNRYQWLSTHYVVLCMLGILLSAAYLNAGLVGVIVFALPALMIRYAQKQYLDQTRSSMSELGRLNQQLRHANEEVRAASAEIAKLNDELFLTIGKIVDARDPYVSGHASKVAEYAVAIGKDLGLSGERLKHVQQAALLHDIGKLGIPEQILFKPDKLTDAEYETVKTHAALGADFLETSTGLRGVADLVRHHHEWWNGCGYPQKLAGDAIPLESRIIAICDALEAMVSDRPYHHAMALAEVTAELMRSSGTQFDPAVVDVTIAVIEREGATLIMNSAYEVLRKQVGKVNDGLALDPQTWVTLPAET